MNFLAHAWLSGNDDELLLGNFVADSVKGKAADNYSLRFRQGIALHRAIDHYTDHHPLVQACNRQIQPHFRKFAGVVTDIYFDHFLAVQWHAYSTEPLSVYAQNIYALLYRNFERLPPRSQRILPWMKAQDWLAGYARFETLDKVFGGMSRRTSFDSGMERAVEVLQEEYAFFENSFDQFFPELAAFAQSFREKLAEGHD